MLELRGVAKLYRGIPAVADVSFIARAGEVTGYLGPNGSGKSTTLKMITGLIQPSAGEILFNGESISQNRTLHKQRLGYVPEEPHLYPHLSGNEYLEMIGQLRGMPQKILSMKITDFLRLFSLLADRHVPLISYSKGMRQRILISAALLHNPDLILLDEPFSGLDVGSTLILRDLITKLAERGKVVLFSSHELDMVERIAARVVILSKGKVVANDSIGNLRTVMTQQTLEGIFSQLAVEQDTQAITREIMQVMEH